MTYEDEVIAEVLAEVSRSDPVAIRFRNIYFVSKSKGRKRIRPRPKEVHLIRDRNKLGRCVSFHLFPFDDVASEVFPMLSGLEGESKLIKLLQK